MLSCLVVADVTDEDAATPVAIGADGDDDSTGSRRSTWQDRVEEVDPDALLAGGYRAHRGNLPGQRHADMIELPKRDTEG